MKYINKDMKGTYADFDFELDENYSQGSTLDDFKAGKWIKLSDEQIAFHNANSTASIQEVLNMQLNMQLNTVVESDTEKLERVKQAKIDSIWEWDSFSNKFFISFTHYKKDTNGGYVLDESGNKTTEEIANVESWMDQPLRTTMQTLTLPSLKSDGKTTTKLWSNTTPPQSVTVPVDWAAEKIPLLELYAKATYDCRAGNIASTYAATTVDEVNAIDIKSNFPKFLTFELNIDTWNLTL